MDLPSISSMTLEKFYNLPKAKFPHLWEKKSLRGSAYLMKVKLPYKPLYKFHLLMTNLAFSGSKKLSADFSQLLILLCSSCLRQKQSSIFY